MPKGRTDFNVPTNSKRADAKKDRGKGKLAMKEKGLDHSNTEHHIQWAKKFDPLFGIKGIDRHLKLKEMR